ncbi:hypothetical protein AB1Y20_019083 [Prymnesium parvum]|uniref:CCHC-type domain-containing protein n=1 Tax=Prymnesium parvum TaxID=97485 RepID=A0AB34JQ20_PRYPA
MLRLARLPNSSRPWTKALLAVRARAPIARTLCDKASPLSSRGAHADPLPYHPPTSPPLEKPSAALAEGAGEAHGEAHDPRDRPAANSESELQASQAEGSKQESRLTDVEKLILEFITDYWSAPNIGNKHKAWNLTKRLRKLQRRIFSEWPLELNDGKSPGQIDRRELLKMVHNIGGNIDDKETYRKFMAKAGDLMKLRVEDLFDGPALSKYERWLLRQEKRRQAEHTRRSAAPQGSDFDSLGFIPTRPKKCHNCGQQGHSIRQCPEPIR